MRIKEHINLFEELLHFKKEDFEIIKNPEYDISNWGDQIAFFVRVTKRENSEKKIPIYSSMRFYWHNIESIRERIVCYFKYTYPNKQGE